MTITWIVWALMLNAAYNTGVVLADKPYKITWTVNYGTGIEPQTYKRRFKTELAALQMYFSAPRCSPTVPAQYPCVEKIEMQTVYVSDDPKA
jgi:hypothetical protein